MALTPEAAAITAAVEAWSGAWQRKDRAALERLAVEDYVEFTGHSRAPRVGRSTLLSVADRALEAFTILEWEILQPVVRREGNVAIVFYRWRDVVERDGERQLQEGVASDVLVSTVDGWHYIEHHSSRMD